MKWRWNLSNSWIQINVSSGDHLQIEKFDQFRSSEVIYEKDSQSSEEQEMTGASAWLQEEYLL